MTSAKLMREGMLKLGAQLVRTGASATTRKVRIDDETSARYGLDDLRRDPALASLFGWAIEWARAGWPQVTLGHRLAASLMATSMAPDVMPELAVPWPAFAVQMPNALLHALDARRVRQEVASAHVLVHEGEGRILATGEHGTTWASAARPLADLADDSTDRLESIPLEEQDTRMLAMLDRLFVGVCAELSSPEARERIAKVAAKVPRNGTPKPQVHKLSREVSVDVRAAVRDYVDGGGKSPSVQSLVRGHWKRQRHGEGREMVKWIQIAPYWRGLDEAPGAVREHVLRDPPR